jgi:hypothetical protein
MKRNLHDYFAEMARTVPVNENKSFTFTSQSFLGVPDQLEADQLVIRKTHLYYEGSKVDRLQFFAPKATYREFGLLILSVVFRPQPSRVHVVLTNRSSNIKNLIVEYRKHGARIRTPDLAIEICI